MKDLDIFYIIMKYMILTIMNVRRPLALHFVLKFHAHPPLNLVFFSDLR